ncbi:MAG: hypothetical protein K0B15_16815, partial [Lentimicrobium sp.]|nr:hypothetical protein [Lentimicrobium sp.]
VLGISDSTVSFAYSSVELETGGFLVSTSIVDTDTYACNLGVYRVDESGNLMFHKTVSGMSDMNKYGRFIRKMEGNNYCIVSTFFRGSSQKKAAKRDVRNAKSFSFDPWKQLIV